MENVVQKINSDELHAKVLTTMVEIMYSNDLVFGEEAVKRAQTKILALHETYLEVRPFIKYFQNTWMSKMTIWLT